MVRSPTRLFRFSQIWYCMAQSSTMDCYDTALQVYKERIQFERPIASFQLQQKKLAEMITRNYKSTVFNMRLGVLRNEGRVTSAQISMCKRNNVDMALNCARGKTNIRRNGNNW